MKWQVGNTCYFIQNNRWVCEAQIVSINGDFVQVKYGHNAGFRIRKNRIFATAEEAKSRIPRHIKSPHL